MSHSMIIQCFNVKEIINSIFSGIFRFFKNRTCQVSFMLCRLRILTVLIGEPEQHKKRVWYMHTADTCRRSSVRKICGITCLFKSSPPHHTGWPPSPSTTAISVTKWPHTVYLPQNHWPLTALSLCIHEQARLSPVIIHYITYPGWAVILYWL